MTCFLPTSKSPRTLPHTSSAQHVYPVLLDDRDRVAAEMKQLGVETNVHYPVPCHLQPGYAHLGYRAGDFPTTERLARRELSLPIYPEIDDMQIAYVAQTLRSVMRTVSV